MNEDKNLSKEINVEILDNNSFLLEGKNVSKEMLLKIIKEDFNKNGVKSIRLYYTSENTFEEYFKILEASKKVINELRNEYSINAFGVNYSLLNREQQQLIREKYFWHIIDNVKQKDAY